MEQEIPFKIFPLKRLTSCHVSTVKPHTVVGNNSFIQNVKSPLRNENAQNIIKNSKDCLSLKVSTLPFIEEESSESINQLYSKLLREAEKIKKWKSVVEVEVKDKDTKLQEKRKMIDAQRKVIQELQFENENLRLKLEDVILENEDLINQSNATRHLCNLLKDTCDRAAEKADAYESEIDETRQMYGDLNNNIERMIMAFEELHEKAENSRQDICNQIIQETEKRKEMQKEHNLELARSRKQISEMTKDKEDQNCKLLGLQVQLNESSSRVKELEETTKNNNLELDECKRKAEESIQQLSEANLLLQNAKDALRSRETELQNAKILLTDTIKEKEMQLEEVEETNTLKLSTLQSKVVSLQETLISEQRKLEENDIKLKMVSLEVQDKSFELEELKKINENQKKEIKKMTFDLDESIKVQKDLENQVAKEKSENQILLGKQQDFVINQENHQEQFQKIVIENTDLKKLVGDLQEVQVQLQDTLKSKEEVIDHLKIKTSASCVDVENLSRKIEELKTELSQAKTQYAEQKMAYEKVVVENEEIARKMAISTKDLRNIQKDLKASKQNNDQTMKTIEKLEKANDQLRKEYQSLKEQLTLKDKECRNQHKDDKLGALKKQVENKNKTIEELQQEKRNTESEISKKEKKLKALENQLGAVKKQIENKNKTVEELQQENKSLKKKMKEECNQCSVLDSKVNGLLIQIENAAVQHEAVVSTKEMEIADAKTKEEKLHGEVERLKFASEEAIKLQKETDIRCQHKIAEMVALMEKHKNQYDKIVEEKDAELDQFRAREHEIYSKRTSMETDLSNKNNELVTLRIQLQQEKEEKDNIIKEKMYLKRNMKHKEVQTIFTDTSKQTTKVGDIKNSSPYTKTTQLTDLSYCLETSRKSDKKDTSPWMSSRNSKYTVPQTYSVKTPTKYETLQHENVTIYPQDSTKKKRRVALKFDFHSDSSDQTDILGICGDEEVFKTVYERSYIPSDDLTSTPKNIVAEVPVKSPGFFRKTSTMKKMREAGWAAISKVDRKRKMKAAEKIFK
ncbi:synaptonemal complex protein 1 [Pseudophryne corroboree]|uniref:synaptonemal complex protein 1 n=1 Tax=Pseudophryne corroboree TaxID=495146 RepID=UPI0030819000